MANWKIELREKDPELEKIVESIYELYPTAIKEDKKSTRFCSQPWTCGSYGDGKETYRLIDKRGNESQYYYEKETKICTCEKINDISERIWVPKRVNGKENPIDLIISAEYMTWDCDHKRVKAIYQKYEKKICNRIPELMDEWLKRQFERGIK